MLTTNKTSSSILIISVLLTFLFITTPNAQTPEKVTFTREGMYPESFAYHQPSNTIIAGSIMDGNLYQIDISTGELSVFTTDLPEGSNTVGVHIDANWENVWACVAGDDSPFQGVVAYEISTRRRLFLTSMEGVDTARDDLGVTCNDIATTPDGRTGYVTESFGDRIFSIDVGSGDITLVSNDVAFRRQDPDITYGLDGIEYIPDTNTLLISHIADREIFKYEIDTQTVSRVSMSSIVRADGIKFYNRDWTRLITAGGGEVVLLESTDGWNTATILERVSVTPSRPWDIASIDVIDNSIYVLQSYLADLDDDTTDRSSFSIDRLDQFSQALGESPSAYSDPNSSGAMNVFANPMLVFSLFIGGLLIAAL